MPRCCRLAISVHVGSVFRSPPGHQTPNAFAESVRVMEQRRRAVTAPVEQGDLDAAGREAKQAPLGGIEDGGRGHVEPQA